MRCRSWRKLNQTERLELRYLGLRYPSASGVRVSTRLEQRGLVKIRSLGRSVVQTGENTWQRIEEWETTITAKGLYVLATWQRLGMLGELPAVAE